LQRDAEQKAAELAAAVEMLHMASLIHDDILDGALTRRNQPSLHAQWGTHRSVLMGDWLFATTFSSVAAGFPLAVTRSLLESSKALCDGEIEETAITFDAAISEDRYLEVIGKKTAALMAGACESGALLGGANRRAVAGLREYGFAFGMAFQLIDDALDFSAHEHEVGKPVGSDIVEGKFTMPVLSLRDSLRGAERGRLLDLLTPKSLSNGGARVVIDMVRDRGGVERTLARAEAYLHQALKALGPVPAPARKPLEALASYALDRRT
jgi:geranylgeranyl pyrophosphate synthase